MSVVEPWSVGTSSLAPSEACVVREPVTAVLAERGWVRALKGHINHVTELKFKEGDRKVRARSYPVLADLQRILQAEPRLRFRIEAHTSDRGDAPANLALSQARAADVRRWLTGKGLDPSRLEAFGCGQSTPVAPNSVPWGRKKNERIEIHLLYPVPASGVRSNMACKPSE